MNPLTGTLESCDGLDGRQFALAVRRLADSLQYGTDASPFVGKIRIEYQEGGTGVKTEGLFHET